jgi:hypothetical protein
MSGRILEVNGRKVWLLESGRGAPLLYLHGFADVHAVRIMCLSIRDRRSHRAS